MEIVLSEKTGRVSQTMSDGHKLWYMRLDGSLKNDDEARSTGDNLQPTLDAAGGARAMQEFPESTIWDSEANDELEEI